MAAKLLRAIQQSLKKLGSINMKEMLFSGGKNQNDITVYLWCGYKTDDFSHCAASKHNPYRSDSYTLEKYR